MDYYKEIKNELINNEIYKKVKDYSKNKNDLITYYNVGKLLLEAGNKYGDNIIKDYSIKLRKELDNKYSVRYLYDIRKIYTFAKMHPLDAQLTISHYRILISLKNHEEIKYYINETIKRNLSKRQLQVIIKNNEYERLPYDTKEKLKINEDTKIQDLVKNPIIINNKQNIIIISEKMLQKLILEDIPYFLEQLGDCFSFIKNEYKIKLGSTYNYIDLLLFNIKYNCYVVVELKTTELKKEHIGQIQVYMNYIDKNIKSINQDNTIGIIIVKKDNKFIIEYSSDERIFETTYKIKN